jgi:hypothetical protein
MRAMRHLPILLTILIPLLGSGCTGARSGEAGDGASAWRRTELSFGLSRRGAPDVSEAEWREFVTTQVVPAFPGGFTELPAQGHYREEGQSRSEAVRVLVVLHPADRLAADNRALDRLARAYCVRFGQDAVLRADSAVTLTFLSADQ